jgi:hypothetical protein
MCPLFPEVGVGKLLNYFVCVSKKARVTVSPLSAVHMSMKVTQWKNSCFTFTHCQRQQEVSVPFVTKLRTDHVQGMLATFTSTSAVFQSAIQIPNTKQLQFLPFVSYGCETRSLTLKKAYWLRMFENMRRICRSRREEITDCRKFDSVELHDLLFWNSPVNRKIKSRSMRWTRHVTCRRNAYKIMVGNS